MIPMTKKYITFKHWKTNEEITIEYKPMQLPVHDNSDRIIVWDVEKKRMEDIIKDTIVRVWDEI